MSKTAEEMRIESEVGQRIFDLLAGVDENIGLEVLFRSLGILLVATATDRQSLNEQLSRLPETMTELVDQYWDNIREQTALSDPPLGGVN